MGQKTHPVGFRLGISKTWDSRWFSERDFKKNLEEDLTLRKYVVKRLNRAGISKVEIERRTSNQITVNIHTARPGIVIGRKGMEVDKLRDELKLLTKKDVFLNIIEVKHPELEAKLVADSIARQLEQRVSFRRAMKKAVTSAMRLGAEGIRVACSGRLGERKWPAASATWWGGFLFIPSGRISIMPHRHRSPHTARLASRCGYLKAKYSICREFRNKGAGNFSRNQTLVLYTGK